MEGLISDMMDMDLKIDSQDIIIQLLMSLPSSYDHVITSILYVLVLMSTLWILKMLKNYYWKKKIGDWLKEEHHQKKK